MRRSSSTHPSRRVLLALAALVGLAACEFDESTVAPGRPRPVVHMVLNPFGGREYTLLLERTLTGRIDARGERFDPDDPIVSGEGEPITGAIVILKNERGDSAIGLEDVSVRTDGKGRGVYRFLNVARNPLVEPPPPHAINIARGQQYRLRILLSDGTVILGTTTTPQPTLQPDTAPTRTFDREGAAYAFDWPAAERTFRYAVQIQTPHGPFEMFTADASIALTGDLRNVFAERFPLVFFPGFRQDLLVLAVDENYFDYYRSANDPFTGSGLLTHLDGATGVLGSVVPIRQTRVEVVAPVDEPGEGTWQPVDDDSEYPTRLTIYYSGAVVSGRIDDADELPFRRAVLGTRAGPAEAPRLSIAALDDQLASDTAYTFTAEVSSAGILGTRDGPGAALRAWRRVDAPAGP